MSESGYELIAKIASGGMASVHLARRRGAAGFSRIVAVKLPHEWVLDDPTLAASLEREAFAASRLHHANVVSVLDVSEIDKKLAIVMEYVDGVSMSALMAPYRRELSINARCGLRILLDACAGLQAAHDVTDDHGQAMAIIHRDVSPQNILVGRDGTARLTDFGIAKVRAQGGEATHSGVVKGKLAYVAPEYLAGGEPLVASDQFSLAVVAWEMLTGRRLFKGATDAETVLRVSKASVEKPSSVNPQAAPFDEILLRALARDPARRFPSIRAMAAELSGAAGDQIASHVEVAALVEDVAGDTLSERRKLLADAPEGPDSRSTSASTREQPATRVTAPLDASLKSPGVVQAEGTATGHVTTTLSPRTPSRLRTLLVAVPLVGIAAVGSLFLIRSRGAEPVASPEVAPNAAPIAPAPRDAPNPSARMNVEPAVPTAAPVEASASASPSPVESVARPTKFRPGPVKKPRAQPTTKKTTDRAPPNPYGK